MYCLLTETVEGITALTLMLWRSINGKAWSSAAEIGIQAEADITAIQQPKNCPKETTSDIYNLQGQKMTGNKASWPKGIYVYQGRKVMLNRK